MGNSADDTNVEQIFKKIQAQRELTLKEVVKPKHITIIPRMEKILKMMLLLMDDGRVPRKDVDSIKRDVPKLFDYVVMNLDPDVIRTLINQEITKKFKAKVLAN